MLAFKEKIFGADMLKQKNIRLIKSVRHLVDLLTVQGKLLTNALRMSSLNLEEDDVLLCVVTRLQTSVGSTDPIWLNPIYSLMVATGFILVLLWMTMYWYPHWFSMWSTVVLLLLTSAHCYSTSKVVIGPLD